MLVGLIGSVGAVGDAWPNPPWTDCNRPPMNSSAKAKATATARNPASPDPSTEPAQTDAVPMKRNALGHLLVDPVVAT